MQIIKKSWVSDDELTRMFSSSYWNNAAAEKNKSPLYDIRKCRRSF